MKTFSQGPKNNVQRLKVKAEQQTPQFTVKTAADNQLLVEYLDSLKQPYINVQRLPSQLQEQVANMQGIKLEKQIRKLLITDPVTNQVFVQLTNPRIPIRGFSNPPAGCIDLECMISKDTPDLVDFGFDEFECKIIKDERDAWAYMCDIMKPKYK